MAVYPQDGEENNHSKELQAIRDEIVQLSRDLEEQVSNRDSERENLAHIEKQAVELEQALQQTRSERGRQEARVVEIEGQITAESGRQVAHRDSLAALVYATYVMGDRSYLKMLLNQENPYSLGRTINYYRYISTARNVELEEIREELSSLKQLGRDKEREVARLRETETRHGEQVQKLESTRRERDHVLVSLLGKINSTEGRLIELKEDRKRLERLAGELVRYSSRLPGNASLKGGFEKQRGRLKLPVPGKLQQEFGRRISGSGMPSNGIFIDTEDEAGVQAVFRGQVIYADWLRGFGLLVIVDHGGSYMSLYGHNKLLYKQVGDAVETGENIALSGTTGGLSSPGVYFEIRHDGKPRDPMLWCRL